MLSCFTTRNDSFQKDFIFIFNKRHEICVTFNDNNRNLLAWITPLVGVVVDVHLISKLDMENNLFERNPSFFFEQIVLFQIPSKSLHL